METQTTNVNDWIKDELAKEEHRKFEEKPALKLEENKVETIIIDFSKPFEEWIDTANGNIVKKVIPVKHNGEIKHFWLSTKNPLYRQILEIGKSGIDTFKIIKTGKEKATRYTLVK